MTSTSSESEEFSFWDSYTRFAYKVRHSRRYVMEDEELKFLETVMATMLEREHELPKGKTFFRAQRGVDWYERTDDDGNSMGDDVSGYGPDRMKPLAYRAREGRANPTGIPALYVADTIETAVAEVRPWMDSEVSVATCRLIRPLRVLDLSIGHGQSAIGGAALKHMFGGPMPTKQEKAEAVWIEIDNAFSTPVTTTDEQADYAPTQILAEWIRNAGYEAVVYRSHFGDVDKKGGYNIAIFDPEAVEIVSCAPYRVESIKVVAKQFGNAWYRSKT